MATPEPPADPPPTALARRRARAVAQTPVDPEHRRQEVEAAARARGDNLTVARALRGTGAQLLRALQAKVAALGPEPKSSELRSAAKMFLTMTAAMRQNATAELAWVRGPHPRRKPGDSAWDYLTDEQLRALVDTGQLPDGLSFDLLLEEETT